MHIKKLKQLTGDVIRLIPLPKKDHASGMRLMGDHNRWLILSYDERRLELKNAITDDVGELVEDSFREFREPDFLVLRGQVFLKNNKIHFEPFAPMPSAAMPVHEGNRGLTLELYDRRLIIYEGVMTFLVGILQEAKTSFQDCVKLLGDTRQVRFLFGRDVQEYIQMLYRKGIELARTHDQLRGEYRLPKGAERTKIVDKDSELLGWFSDQFVASEPLFAKYMSFAGVLGTPERIE